MNVVLPVIVQGKIEVKDNQILIFTKNNAVRNGRKEIISEIRERCYTSWNKIKEKIYYTQY